MRAVEQFLFVKAFQKAAVSDMPPSLASAEKILKDIHKNQYKVNQKANTQLAKENQKLKADMAKFQQDAQTAQMEGQQAQQKAEVDSQKLQMDMQKKELQLQTKSLADQQAQAAAGGQMSGPTPPPSQSPYPGMPGSVSPEDAQSGNQG